MADVYFTIDMCSDRNNPLYFLEKIKNVYSNFKVTALVSLMETTEEYVDLLNTYDWIEVACYGFYGRGREMEWMINKQHIYRLFQTIEEVFDGKFVHGFKAPQYAYTIDSYEALVNKDYWIIEHPNNKNAPFEGIKYFKTAVNYYDVHAKNNGYDYKGIKQYYEELMDSFGNISDINFKFCSENIKIG